MFGIWGLGFGDWGVGSRGLGVGAYKFPKYGYNPLFRVSLSQCLRSSSGNHKSSAGCSSSRKHRSNTMFQGTCS